MLPTDLLFQRQNGETVIPKRLNLDAKTLALASDLITTFQEAKGGTQGELDRQLLELEGDSPDYRIKRQLSSFLPSASLRPLRLIKQNPFP